MAPSQLQEAFPVTYELLDKWMFDVVHHGSKLAVQMSEWQLLQTLQNSWAIGQDARWRVRHSLACLKVQQISGVYYKRPLACGRNLENGCIHSNRETHSILTTSSSNGGIDFI